MIGVVLDTNIVVSALLRPKGLEDQVFRLCLTGRLHLYVSPAVTAEYELVLPRPKFKLEPREVTKVLANLQRAAVVVHPDSVVHVVSDEPDNRFLECAEKAQADFLVTGNKRHFPKRWKTTQIVNAKEFIAIIAPLQGKSRRRRK